MNSAIPSGGTSAAVTQALPNAGHALAVPCRFLQFDNARGCPPPMLWTTRHVGELPGRHVINVGFALALVILAGIALFSYTTIKGYNERAQLVAHTREVLVEIDGVLSDLKDVETSLRGYVISRQESFLDLYRVALASIPGRMARLAQLTADDPGQQQRIAALRALVDKRTDEAVTLLRLRQRSRLIFPDEVRERIGAGKSVMDQIREAARDVRKQEEALLEIRSKKSQRSLRRTVAVIVAGNAAGFSILLIAFLLLRWEIAQRAQAQQSAQEHAAETEDLYNNAPCGYHSLDKDGNFVRINDTELSWLGYSRDEVHRQAAIFRHRHARKSGKIQRDLPAIQGRRATRKR